MKLYRLIAVVGALVITLLVASLPVLRLTGALGAHGGLVRVAHRVADTMSAFASGIA